MEKQSYEMKSEKYDLWWMDCRNNRRYPAGVAFYDEKYGEYRLKIDFLQTIQDEPDQIYLKPVGTTDDRLLYRAEGVVKKNGRFHSRRPIGEGYLLKEGEDEVNIELGPFEKTLILSLT